MCGFAGLLDLSGHRPPQREVLKKMTFTLVHRGPDNEGYYLDQHAGLGFRRLAIIDLAGGNQPMANDSEDGRYVIVFNGEIYNFSELRRDLESRHRFSTKSDTEVLLHLFEEKKEKCLQELVGMFALAIWDKKDRRLFLARDRLGKKPLYYTQTNGRFLFASEIKALLEHPDIHPEIDPRALDLYLAFQAVPSPLTIYKGIKRLPPANFLWIDQKGVGEPQSYWRLDFTRKFNGSPQDAQARILELLKTATAQRMISDVPLGAFLSGGIDSGLVVAMMAEASPTPVKTFTIAFNEKEFSEAETA
ncbi:MAG: asparagine synthase (glutamine-hydrolyzing), partial [Elusimicrobiota bacterium]